MSETRKQRLDRDLGYALTGGGGTVDLTPIEGRLTALEALPPSVTDLTPVESRLDILEAVPPTDLTPLEGRVSTIESELTTKADAGILLVVANVESIPPGTPADTPIFVKA